MDKNAGPVAASPDREKYNSFIAGLELRSISLESCKADFVPENYADGGGTISYKIDVAFDAIGESILDALVSVRARAKPHATHRMCTKVDCIYRLSYGIPSEPDSAMLEAFARNVEINVWPYVRELVHNLTERMAGPTLLMPLRKG